MRKIGAGFFVGLVVLGALPAAQASDVGFASCGVGFGSQAVGAVASLNFSRGHLIYVLRASTTSEFNLFGPSPDLSDTDYAAMIGKWAGAPRSFRSAAVGLSVVHSVRRGRIIEEPYWFSGGTYEKIDRVTVGLPVDLKASLNLGPVGLGVNVFANLNPKGSFAGLAVTMQVGKLR